MHVDVSMYFDITACWRMPVADPHIVAEERLMSSACTAIVVSLRLFQVDEERLVLGRPRVRVADRIRHEVRQWTLMTLRGRVSPMNRKSDMPHRLAIDFHRRQTL